MSALEPAPAPEPVYYFPEPVPAPAPEPELEATPKPGHVSDSFPGPKPGHASDGFPGPLPAGPLDIQTQLTAQTECEERILESDEFEDCFRTVIAALTASPMSGANSNQGTPLVVAAIASAIVLALN